MRLAVLGLGLLVAGVASGVTGAGQRRGGDARRRTHRVQQGPCSYTFILPEVDACRTGAAEQYSNANVAQRDAPTAEADWSTQKLQHLETAMENNTLWLQKLENYIQGNIKTELVQIQAHAVHNQTATMLEMGTNLLTQTAEQTRKLNVVEAQRFLPTAPHWRQLRFRDCAEIYKAGYNTSGVYHIYADSNATEPTKVFCDMQTSGGGWTVFQRRVNGSVDFQRTWKEYKMGFGDVAGEHWLGNEVVFRMTATSQPQYSLRVELQDWEGNSPYSLYDKFQLGDEKQHYRLFLRGYSGTAGMQSSLAAHGTSFSTRDSDHDNCLCKCALMLTGGWWFDACGLSNLNGMYYTVGHNIRKLNGIKWHHFRGPSYSLRSTTMMIRPSDF
nr:angiopoietin-1-like [Paramormyrops kingsleyae]